MDDDARLNHDSDSNPGDEPAAYEAPRIESVSSAEELEREVLYAGAPPSG